MSPNSDFMKKTVIAQSLLVRPLAGVSFSLLLSLLGAVSEVEAKEEWLPLLPEKTIAVLSIKNTPELVADWDGSSLGRFLEDPAVLKWLAPLYEEGEAPWDRMVKEVSGSGLREQLSFFPGASMTAFLPPNEESGSSEPVYLALSEIGEKKAELMGSLEKQAEVKMKEDDELKVGEAEIEGVAVKTVGAGEGDEANWVLAWAEVDGVLVESNDRKTITETIQGMQKGAAGEQDDLRANFARFREIAEGEGDLVLYVDAGTLVEKVKESMAGAGGAEPQAANPFSPELVMGALNLEEIRGFGLSIDLQEGASRVDLALMHKEKPQGLIVNLMHGVDTKVELPGFVPADMASASVSRWSLLKFYDGLMTTLNGFGPMVGGMVQMQLGGVEQQMGIKLRDDLFATTDDEIIQLGAMSKVGGAPGQVMGIKLKDAKRFGAAMEAIKKMAGNGFGVFEEVDVAGFKVFKIKANLAAAQPEGGSNEMAYTVAKDYFLFSSGTMEALNKVLNRMADPSGPTLWDDASVKSALAALPANATGLGVSDGSAMVKTMLTAMMTAQGAMAAGGGKAKKGKGKAKDDEGEEEGAVAGGGQWFDPDATPGDEVFERYFGKSSTGSYTLDDAAHYRMVSQPAEAQ
jgi:hypothetical protein